MSRAVKVTGFLWLTSAYFGSFAWVSRFGFPDQHDRVSAATCAVTGAVFVSLGALFAVIVVIAALDGTA